MRRSVAAVLALACLLGVTGCKPEPVARPVILVTIDALRADRVGAYGGRTPTPALDRLAREGALVEYAVTPMGRTSQGIGSILTGLHPLEHGADGLGMPLPPKPRTLAERFRERGYATAAFVTNLFLRSGLGFERGFDLYSNPEPRWEGNSAGALTDEALAWVDARGAKSPFFLWVHYLDPHWTYEPAERFARAADPDWTGDASVMEQVRLGHPPAGTLLFDAPRVAGARLTEHIARLYDGEVAATDEAVGRLVDGLRQRGILDRAVVLLTADHGEALGAHGYWFGHGEYLYDDVLHVPLIVRAPGVVAAGTRVAGAVPTMAVADALPGLAGLTGSAPQGTLEQSLRRGGTTSVTATPIVHLTDHVFVHDENPRRPVKGREGRWWAVRDGSLKLIRIPLGNGRFDEELYDLANDAAESTNLAASRPGDASRLRELLLGRQRELLARWQESGAVEPPPQEQDVMRSLGYIR